MNHQTASGRSVLYLCLLAWLALIYSWLAGGLPFLSSVVFNKIGPANLGMAYWGDLKPLLPIISLCLFKNTAHFPCLFCGLTRSFVLIGQGHWQESMQYHLLGIPLYGIAVLLATLGIIMPERTGRVIRLFTSKPVLALLFLVFSACWLWKLGQPPQFW